MLKDKIFVTGADGFIGSHLVEELIDLGKEVTAFVNYNSFNSWGWLDSLPVSKKNKIKVVSGDIRDQYAVKKAMNRSETVFHLAALIAIPYSYRAPESYIDTNIKGTLNILQAALELGIDKVITTSTSEVYGTAKFVPITEFHPKQAQSPYSASKIGADSITESFIKSFNQSIVIVRPFNTFGPRQSSRAIIPTLITQLLSGKTEIHLGDLRPTRDFLYVKDTVNGFIEISKSDNLIGAEVNIATQSEISIQQLSNLLIKKINPDAKIVLDENRLRPEKSEVLRLFGSNEKLIKNTNWHQKFSFAEGLDLTIEWFKKKDNLSFYKSEIYNV